MKNIQQLVNESNIDNDALTRDLVFIPELDVIFCFISKNASSFLKSYVRELVNPDAPLDNHQNPHVLENSGFISLLNIDEQRAKALIQDPSIPKVVVGRHPISRFMSAYQSRVLTHQRERYDSHSRESWLKLRQKILGVRYSSHAVPAHLAISEEIALGEVVEYVASTSSGELDQHLSSQAYFALTRHIEYTLRGRVEELDSFLSDFCDLVGKSRLPSPPRALNKSDWSHRGLELDSKQKSQLHSRYADDFEYFGYDHV